MALNDEPGAFLTRGLGREGFRGIGPARLVTGAAAIGLVAAGLLLGGGGATSGLTFRDIAYQQHTCGLTAKSDKVLLSKPANGKGSVGTLTLYVTCNYHPTECDSGTGTHVGLRPCTSARLNGIITEFFAKQQPNGRKYDDFNVAPITRPLPKAGVRETFRVKLPPAALQGLRRGHREDASLQVNLPSTFSCVDGGCTGGRPASLEINTLKGVK